MVLHAVIAVGGFLGLFILFLVLSRTLNNIINHMTKIEYLLRREMEFAEDELVVYRQEQFKIAERRRFNEEDQEPA